LWYLKQFDGWGAWGAAPLFLPVIGLSAIAGLFGIVSMAPRPVTEMVPGRWMELRKLNNKEKTMRPIQITKSTVAAVAIAVLTAEKYRRTSTHT
jgi:hypothetical protein